VRYRGVHKPCGEWGFFSITPRQVGLADIQPSCLIIITSRHHGAWRRAAIDTLGALESRLLCAGVTTIRSLRQSSRGTPYSSHLPVRRWSSVRLTPDPFGSREDQLPLRCTTLRHLDRSMSLMGPLGQWGEKDLRCSRPMCQLFLTTHCVILISLDNAPEQTTNHASSAHMGRGAHPRCSGPPDDNICGGRC
jgi:hypothetical protein